MSTQSLPPVTVYLRAGRCTEHPDAGWDENGCRACWFNCEERAETEASKNLTVTRRRRCIWEETIEALKAGGIGYRITITTEGTRHQRLNQGIDLRRAGRKRGIKISAIVTDGGLSAVNIGQSNTNTRRK